MYIIKSIDLREGRVYLSENKWCYIYEIYNEDFKVGDKLEFREGNYFIVEPTP